MTGRPATASPALEAALRTLKLTAMADMLGERLAQGAAGKLGHAELLALLVGDEQTRREGAGLVRRLAAAHFEATCAVENFDFGYIPAGTIRDLSGLGFLTAGQSVNLHGPVESARRCSPRPWASSPAAADTPSCSRRRPGCSPTSPGATPTEAGRPGCGAGPGRHC